MRCHLLAISLSLLSLAPAAAAEEKPARADLARTIKDVLTAKVPRQFEDLSEWGKTVPISPVRIPRLRRTVVKVGDHDEWPHGVWKRTKVWVDDPARDLTIQVPEVRKVGKNVTRVRVQATATLQGERELQNWVKGVRLLAVTAQGDAVISIGMDLDLTFQFDPAQPLQLQVKANVVDVRLELKDFHLRRVGPVIFVEQGALGQELKDLFQDRLREMEPRVKEHANQVLADALKSLASPPTPTKE
jgi:hypothetical protein